MPRRRPTRSPDRQAETAGYLTRFERYLDAECGLSENTVLAYGRDLRAFTGWLAATSGPSLLGLELETLSRYVEHLRERSLAPASIGRALVAIKMLLRFLQLEGLVSANVAELLASPKLWQKLPTILSPDQIDRLLEAPKLPEDRLWLRDRALLTTMYATGSRASECCGLRMGDLSLPERTARLRGKGRKERLVSLTPLAVEALAAYFEHQRPHLNRRVATEVFLSRTGRPLSRIALWELVKKYARRVGAPESFSPHSMRHSFATHLLAGGADIRALQELLGHASIRTTQIYTAVDSTRMKSVHASCHPRG